MNTGEVALVGCVRGIDDTTAQAHSTGAVVVNWFTAAAWNDFITSYLVGHVQLGGHRSLLDVNANSWISQVATASAINNLQISNAAAGNAPTIAAIGSDTNINLRLLAKGSGIAELPNGSIDFANLLATIFSSQVTTASNPGGGGGTYYYINLGGIKLLWGTLANSVTGTGFQNSGLLAVTFPTSFFGSIQAKFASASEFGGSSAFNGAVWTTISTTGGDLLFQQYSGSNDSGTVNYLVIGS